MLDLNHNKPVGALKAFIHDFKEFAMKGNAIDLAVGVVIGAAFGAVVNSLVKDVIMPPLGQITGGVDFSNKKILFTPAVTDPVTHAILKDEVALRYGVFINQIISFIIIAFSIFMVIKLMSMLQRKQPEAPPPPPELTPDQKLLTEIRDCLKELSTPRQ